MQGAIRDAEFDPWIGKIPLEGGMTSPPPSILAWGVPGIEEPGGLQLMGHRESDTTETT